MESLFREEVLQAQRAQEVGEISLATPLSFKWWGLIALTFAAAIIAFLVFGHYTQRETVTGQLLPSAGLLTLSARTTGTVTQTLVRQGEHVEAGQPLVQVSADLDSASMGNTHAVVSTQLRAQEEQVRTTLANLKPEVAVQTKDLRSRITMLQAQVRQISEQLVLQRQEAGASTHLVQKAAPLHKRGFISTVEFDQYQANALSQQAGINGLSRQRLDTEQQLSTLKAQLAQLPLTTDTRANQLRGQLAQLDAQLAESEAAGGTVLRAPKAGTVSTLLVQQGQNVTIGQPLLSILPQGSNLQAQLLVPSSAIGFVSPGSRVVMRYQAFPYQRFGQQYGKIVQVSRSALSYAEATSLLGTGTGKDTTSSLYLVRVSLERQHIDAYGKAVALKPGMALSADILLGRTSLWAWAFDPLRGLRQQVATDGGQHG